MVGIEIVALNVENIDLLNQFLSNAGSSLQTFRYFQKRSINTIQNHLITYVLKENEQVIGYGHLEREDNKVWLGISLIESAKGKGFGLMMMNSLIEAARKMDIPLLYLSVDKINLAAINLYKKVGFTEHEDLNEHVLLMELRLV
ncbi:N-acetyltransferase family protein [Aquirufa sp. Wall-65K1]